MIFSPYTVCFGLTVKEKVHRLFHRTLCGLTVNEKMLWFKSEQKSALIFSPCSVFWFNGEGKRA